MYTLLMAWQKEQMNTFEEHTHTYTDTHTQTTNKSVYVI